MNRPTYSVDTLRQLAAAGSNFYQSLLHDYNRTGGLTRKQIETLREQPIATPPAQPVTATVDISQIEKAFAAAKESGIQYPKMRLDKFIFSPAPATGRNPGAVYVKDTDEEGTYLGMIKMGGFIRSPQQSLSNKFVEQILEAANHPHEAAVAYGKRFGRCSICARTLTNKLSIDLGIGPICRQRFGW